MSKISGQLASLHYQEYILELTEKALPCGNDISIGKKLSLLPGKMHRKDHPGNSFPLGIQAPIDRQTTMRSNGSVQYKWFSFYSFLSMPKTPPNHFCCCGRRICNVQPLQMCLEAAEE